MATQFEDFANRIREAAADPKGEFFCADGTPRRGANHRNAYWDGRNGKPCTFPPKTFAHAAWKAGCADRKVGA